LNVETEGHRHHCPGNHGRTGWFTSSSGRDREGHSKRPLPGVRRSPSSAQPLAENARRARRRRKEGAGVCFQ
jgi:hypothetical protein